MPPNPSEAQATLKNMSLTNGSLRSFAQAALFGHIHLYGHTAQCHFRARKLLEMLSTREESRGWIKVLRLHWTWKLDLGTNGFEPISPPATGQRGLMDIMSDLFLRLTHLEEFRADCVKISPAMYLRMYRLSSLRTITIYERWSADEISSSSPSVEDLMIEDLCTVGYGGGGTIDEPIARLARSPRLRKLRTRIAIFDSLLRPPHPHVFHTLAELHIVDAGTAHRLVEILTACPNLVSFGIGGYDPETFEQGDMLTALPKHAVPLLKRVNVPLSLAQAMVQGRPVESIIVRACHGRYGPQCEWSKESLTPLTLGSASVKELSFPGYIWKYDSTDIIFELFPSVETLKVHFRGASQRVSRLTVPPLPHALTIRPCSDG